MLTSRSRTWPRACGATAAWPTPTTPPVLWHFRRDLQPQRGHDPANSITREQLAVILYRYAKCKGYDTTQGGMAIREFSDYDNISTYAQSALAWAVNAGLVQGKDYAIRHRNPRTGRDNSDALQPERGEVIAGH